MRPQGSLDGSSAPEVRAGLLALEGRARGAVWALALVAANAAVIGAGMLSQRRLLVRLVAGDLEDPGVYHAHDRLVRLAVEARVAVALVAAVLFLRWLHRAVRQVQALRPELALPSPWRAVAGFFVPVLQLFEPVVTLTRLHQAMDPERLPPRTVEVPDPGAGYRAAARRRVPVAWRQVTAPLSLWWLCFLAPAAESFLLVHAGGEAPRHLVLIEQSGTAAIFEAIRVVAAVLGMLVVRAITRRTVEYGERQAVAAAAGDR